MTKTLKATEPPRSLLPIVLLGIGLLERRPQRLWAIRRTSMR